MQNNHQRGAWIDSSADSTSAVVYPGTLSFLSPLGDGKPVLVKERCRCSLFGKVTVDLASH